ncbi:MAG: metal-dependent hydrolase [bacterium]
MSPITHFFLSWLVANSANIDRRDRALVTIAGVIPDLDGLVIIADFLTQNSERPLQWWGNYHHVLAHNIGFAILVTLGCIAIAKRRLVTPFLVWITFHIHLIGDVIGARGPDGNQWPIPYLLPFSDTWQWSWRGQWALNAWPNFLITGAAIFLTFFLAWKRGYSPIEIFSKSADRVFVGTLHGRFGNPVS